jgi:hypothetical protein
MNRWNQANLESVTNVTTEGAHSAAVISQVQRTDGAQQIFLLRLFYFLERKR